MKKFLIKMPKDFGDGKGYKIKTYKNEKEAAILETEGEVPEGFDVIAEVTGNYFYSDDGIYVRGGKLLTFETERRWVVKIPDNISEYRCHEIEQDYLAPGNGFQGRIRRWDDRYIYTEKARTGSLVTRIENEREISPEEYQSLKKRTILHTIKKRRYIIPWQGLTFELDIFDNIVERGYGIMEAELPDRDTPVQLPDFVEIVKEVTDDPYYTNKNFAGMEKIKLFY